MRPVQVSSCCATEVVLSHSLVSAHGEPRTSSLIVTNLRETGGFDTSFKVDPAFFRVSPADGQVTRVVSLNHIPSTAEFVGKTINFAPDISLFDYCGTVSLSVIYFSF